MDRRQYIVALAGNNNRILKVFDAATGMLAGQFSSQGEVMTPPIVVGNMVSYVINTPGFSNMGVRKKLPGGMLISYFKV
tara:strand:+ start:3384 stop:3620 length:237 start_codon:yes stop_codon:yes gene_type:complete